MTAHEPLICECGHSNLLHGFGMGECWPCAFRAAAEWMDGATDCHEFRLGEPAEEESA